MLGGPVAAQTSSGNQAVETALYSFDLRAGSLRSAVARISSLSGWRILYDGGVASDTPTRAVSGRLSVTDALNAALAGTGLGFRLTGPRSVSIFRPGEQAAAGSDGAGLPGEGETTLETIVISSGGGAAQPGVPFTPDTPYETAGSVSHISQDQLDRVPATATGDVFRNTPGVISVGSRIGTSIQPNIRGLSGNGRVKVTVDGSEQTVSAYRGYNGTRDETYIDPDFIGGVDITKGPDAAGGGFGGTVAFRTLSVEDLITDPARNWGVRLKGGFGGNSSAPPRMNTTVGADRPGFFEGDSWQGNVAGAFTSDHFDVVAAYGRRKQGNYFAGTRAAKGIVFPPGIDIDGDGIIFPLPFGKDRARNTTVPKGSEVFNTSEDATSFMLKGTGKWGDGHSLELGYRLYDNKQGEIYEFDVGTGTALQRAPTTIRVDNYTAKYRWRPSDNDLVNLRANLYQTFIDSDRYSNGWAGGDHRNRTTGGDIGNRAILDTDLGTLTLDGGFSFTYEDTEAAIVRLGNPNNYRLGSNGPTGTRLKWSGHLSAKLEATDWLELSGEARYDAHRSVGKGLAQGLPDNTGSRLSPGFGVILKPVDGLQLFASYKEGYRAPSLRESHWIGDNARFNPDLKREISRNWEFGANILRDDVITAGDSLRFKAVWFDNRYEDYIYRARSRIGAISFLRYENVDRANFEGFELSGSYDAGTFFLEGAFTKYANIEYCTANGHCFLPAINQMFSPVDPFGADFTTGYIPPEWSGSVTAGVRLFDRRLTLGGRASFAGTRYGTEWDKNEGRQGTVGLQFTWPEYAVYDLFGSYKFSDNAMLNFSVENITDRYYFDAMVSAGVPSPGRTARASLTFKF